MKAAYVVKWQHPQDGEFWLDDHGRWADNLSDARVFHNLDLVNSVAEAANIRLRSNAQFGVASVTVLRRA